MKNKKPTLIQLGDNWCVSTSVGLFEFPSKKLAEAILESQEIFEKQLEELQEKLNTPPDFFT